MKILILLATMAIVNFSYAETKASSIEDQSRFEESRQVTIRAKSEQEFMYKLNELLPKVMDVMSNHLVDLNDFELKVKYHNTITQLKKKGTNILGRLGVNENTSLRETLEIIAHESSKEIIIGFYEELFTKCKGNITYVSFTPGFVNIRTKSVAVETFEKVSKQIVEALLSVVFAPTFNNICSEGCDFIP